MQSYCVLERAFEGHLSVSERGSENERSECRGVGAAGHWERIFCHLWKAASDLERALISM